MKLSAVNDLFYSWECVSLILETSTVDFVIKDVYNMMYLLHVLQHYKMQPPPPGQRGCLKPFKILKFKMKLAYECWLQQITLQDIWYTALRQTIFQLRKVALYKLQRIVAKDSKDRKHRHDSRSIASISDESSYSSESSESIDSLSNIGNSKLSLEITKERSRKSSTLKLFNRRLTITKQPIHNPLVKSSLMKTMRKTEPDQIELIEKSAQNIEVKKRLKQQQHSNQKLIKIIRQFIEQKNIQIQYLNLIKEDNINPFMNILKIASIRRLKFVMPQSCHFYLLDDRMRRMEKYKAQNKIEQKLDKEFQKHALRVDQFDHLVTLKIKKSGLNISK